MPGSLSTQELQMKRTVVWLTDSQVSALTKISQKSLAPVSALVRQAVATFLTKRGYHNRKEGQRKAARLK